MEENPYGPPPMSLDTTGQTLLRGAARWAQFMAVAAFVASGMMIVMALTAPLWFSAMRNLPGAEMNGMLSMGSGMFMGTYLFAGLIQFFFALYLYRFAVRAQRALALRDGAVLDESLAALGGYFRVQGILLIVFLGFMALALVGGLIGGIVAGMMAM